MAMTSTPHRCAWCGTDPLYVAYHDQEWGHPTQDDRVLFEKLCLEGFQAGLSWITILRRRESFRAAFAGFDVQALQGFGDADVERLLQDPGIIRHRGKIEAVIHNARQVPRIVADHGSLAAYIWSFEPAKEATGEFRTECPESQALSRSLKRDYQWKFLGPTSAYAFMQSMGLVNDHVPKCEAREACHALRQAFVRPR
jgi:DNA-3-methyladenine glycosylase I